MRYPCYQCDYAATRASHLKRHIESKHEGERYPCPECEHAATTASDLTRHVTNNHEGMRYTCSQRLCCISSRCSENSC